MKIWGAFLVVLGSVAVGFVPDNIIKLLLTITSVSLAMTGSMLFVLGCVIDAKQEEE